MMASSADIIKKIRIHIGLEQGEFAEKLGISKAAVCNYEKGLRTPRFPIIRRMRELAKENGMEYTIEDFLSESK